MPSPGSKKILIVEDEHDILQLVKLYLEKDGFRTVLARTGTEGLRQVKQEKPDLVVLDLMLPEVDGLEVCKRLRSAPETAMLPIIMLTAKAEESDTVVGLELGADDYVTKPFSPRELVARVRAVLRRAGGAPHREEELAMGPVRVQVDRRRVHVDDREVELTATEFALLTHLMRAPARVFTREQLLGAVWGYSAAAGTRTVDVHVAQLRAKLGSASPIRTVRGTGYAAERR
jgi:phosphate regulon transcriptional regulator PhoB